MSPSGERSWTYDLGETEAQGLDAPQGSQPQPCLALGLANRAPVFLPRHSPSQMARGPGPGSPCAAPVPRPCWCWVSQGRAPAAHSWQRPGGWEPEKAVSPQIPRRGSPITASPVVSAPSCHLPLSLLGKRRGRPAFLHSPLPTAAFPNLLLPQQAPGPSPNPLAVSGGPHSGVLGGVPLLPGALGSIYNVTRVPGSFVSRTPPVRPARVGTSPPPTQGSGRPLS